MATHKSLQIAITLRSGRATLYPSRLVSRLSIPTAKLEGSEVFECSDPSLGNIAPEQVLLARLSSNANKTKQHVLVEHLDNGLYGLVFASSTLDLPTITTSRIHKPGALGLPDITKPDWWQAYETDDQSPALASPDNDLVAHFDPVVSTESASPSSMQDPVLLDVAEDLSPDLFITQIQSAYQDVLYRSRASLVYYVKSTLPRQLQKAEKCMGSSEYMQYIRRGLCPELVNVDRKYKDYLPSFIKAKMTALPIEIENSYLHPLEIEAMGDWLDMCIMDSLKMVPDIVINNHLKHLKTREYELIVLILLECLTDSLLSEQEISATELYIDILVDRLTIAQSLDLFSHDDPLRTFCNEVVTPFYSSRVPHTVRALASKCAAQYAENVSTAGPGLTANTERKRKRKIAPEVPRAPRTATFKRTRSAPANLLSSKKPNVKRSTAKREVSMTKKVPLPEPAAPIPTMKRASTLEETKRFRLEPPVESVLVEATPTKHNPYRFIAGDVPRQLHFSPKRDSKASFMAIGETPTKQRNEEHVVATPRTTIFATPNARGIVTLALEAGVQDTPSGRSITFKLDTPRLSRNNSYQTATASRITDTNVFASPSRSVNGKGLFADAITGASPIPALSLKRHQSLPNFGKDNDTTNENVIYKQTALKDALDWL